ncbi:hypothetical protein BHAP_0335 [Bifidobacterium hapali]|uniref:Uncharacterized protein n=1 Tax=Bifidobacterium hapali TaxID=1630172 RepID=A0A261G5I6_9BIFI|nr:hypothetical protein BHAP_0335 [Bifidobacterium hapali]
MPLTYAIAVLTAWNFLSQVFIAALYQVSPVRGTNLTIGLYAFPCSPHRNSVTGSTVMLESAQQQLRKVKEFTVIYQRDRSEH